MLKVCAIQRRILHRLVHNLFLPVRGLRGDCKRQIINDPHKIFAPKQNAAAPPRLELESFTLRFTRGFLKEIVELDLKVGKR